MERQMTNEQIVLAVDLALVAFLTWQIIRTLRNKKENTNDINKKKH
jgi:hypothetical protein